jgi:hypothetical protein
VSADQSPTRRPKAVTQRDGSSLQNANCRMASISTGLDYETRGAKTSTGGKMRSHTTDQEGGTDSGDAKQAWDRGYAESLLIEDGSPWGDVLTALRAGKAVNLDVWHETVGGPCLSGSGRYGHNIFVLPDCRDNAWLVSDPWCKPPTWVRVSESRLRAGAEEWGRRVFDSAGPGELPPPNHPDFRRVLALLVKRLMSRYYPGHPAPTGQGDGDTGGASMVLFTTTHPQPLEGSDMGTQFTVTSPPIGKATTTKSIGIIPTEGGDYVPVESGYVRNVYAESPVVDGPYAGSAAYLVMLPQSDKSMGLLLASACTYVPNPVPEPAPGDCAAEVKARDAAWQEALMNGGAWPAKR